MLFWQDRYAGLTGFRGRGGARGAPRGLSRGLGGRGGFRGGAMGGGDGRNFSDDIYAPYEGPDGATRSSGGGFGSAPPSGPASHGGSAYGAPQREYVTGEPSQQIMVRNVRESVFCAVYFALLASADLWATISSCLGPPPMKI